MIDSFLLRVFDLDVRVALMAGFSEGQAEEVRASWTRCMIPDFSKNELGSDQDVFADFENREQSEYTAAVCAETPGAEPKWVHAPDFAMACEMLVSTITLCAINARVGRHIMLHAAGLADSRGRAVALVAPSGTGKTTASRALGRDFSYLTDETVFLEGISILPYPKPLSVIEDPNKPKKQHSPDSLGLRSPESESRLTAIALLNRVDALPAGSDDVLVEALPAADALHRLVPQMSGAPSMPDVFSQMGALFDEVQGVLQLTYSDSAKLSSAISRILEGNRPTLASEFLGMETSEETGGRPAGLYSRARRYQSALIDERLLVMLPTMMIEVSPLGHVIWDALASPASLADITGSVVAELGSHENAENIVLSALNAMAEQGLIFRPDASDRTPSSARM